MISDTKVFPRWVKDPLYSCVKNFLQKRWDLIKQEGDLVDRNLAEDRYQGMSPASFIIESTHTTPDGVERACLIRRDRQFTRVDMVIEKVNLRQVFDDQKVSYDTIMNKDDFIKKFKQNAVQGKLFYLTWRNGFGICISREEAQTLTKADELFNNVFFEELILNIEDNVNPETLVTGTVVINDKALNPSVIQVFIIEDVIEVLQLDKIHHNFPPTMIAKRGEQVRHLMSLTVADDDVTANVNLVFTTSDGRVACSKSPNNLESVFDFIRGSSTAELTDTITIDMSTNYNGKIFTQKAVIQVTIAQDTLSSLKLTGYPVTVSCPSGMKMALVIKGTLNDAPINFSQAPSNLTSMLYGINLVSKGLYNGGLLYVGLVNKIVQPNEVFKDLVKGQFGYNEGSNAYKATAFIETEIVQPRTQYTQLDLVEPLVTTLSGVMNTEGELSYKVSCEGKVVPNTNLDYLNGVLGARRLLEIQTTRSVDKVAYKLIKDSGVPGQTIYDDVIFSTSYINPNGLLFERNDKLKVEVKKASSVQVVKTQPDIINVNKYDIGALPFKVLVNGDDVTPYLIVNITDSTNQIRKPLSNPSSLRAWQVLNVLSNGGQVSVTFTFTTVVDGVNYSSDFIQKFNLAKWTGKDTVFIPNPVTINGKSGDKGSITGYLYYQDKLAGSSASIVQSSTSLIPGFTLEPLKQGNPLVLNYLLSGTGSNGVSHLAISRNGSSADADVALIDINTTILPDDGVKLNVQGINNTKVYELGLIPSTITYQGNSVPLNDPRVTLTLKALNQPDGILVMDGVDSAGTKIRYRVNTDIPMGTTLGIDSEVDLVFKPDATTALNRAAQTLINVARMIVTSINVNLLSTPIAPNQTDKVIQVKFTDQTNTPILGGKLDTILFTSVNETFPIIDDFKNGMREVDRINQPGVYEFTISTSNFGGGIVMNLKMLIGGVSVAATNIDTPWIVAQQPLLFTGVNSPVGVQNVKTTVRFNLTQVRKPSSTVPINAKTIEVVDFDQVGIKSYSNLKRLDDNGNYSVDITSAGQIGNSFMNLKFNTPEGLTQSDFPWLGRLEFTFTR